jgi:hypothetical protein
MNPGNDANRQPANWTFSTGPWVEDASGSVLCPICLKRYRIDDEAAAGATVHEVSHNLPATAPPPDGEPAPAFAYPKISAARFLDRTCSTPSSQLYLRTKWCNSSGDSTSDSDWRNRATQAVFAPGDSQTSSSKYLKRRNCICVRAIRASFRLLAALTCPP